MPNGGRINMGAYGGTARASMSEAWLPDSDINRDGTVNMIDLAVLAQNWLRPEQVPAGNRPLGVNITAPHDGAVLSFFPWPRTIEIKAEVSDIDGFVVKVEFFANGNKIGEDTDGADGWVLDWRDWTTGEYVLIARATDDDGASTDSTAIEIGVRPPPGR